MMWMFNWAFIAYQTGIIKNTIELNYYLVSRNVSIQPHIHNGINRSETIGYEKSNNCFMLSVLRQGRLGNGMWQYCALLGLANMTNRIPILNSGYRDISQIFTLSTPIDNRINMIKTSVLYQQRQLFINVQETAQTLRNISENVTLRGYFQHFRFFASVSEKIRKEFRFRKNIKQQVSTFFKSVNLTNKEITKVGIHIRRTDLNQARKIKLGFGPPPTNYFRNAMGLFRSRYKNVYFVVCSDDIKWARKHLRGGDILFVTNNTPAVDMAILASCNHVIVSNGTFSWWVGWLCTGITVRYRWMPKYDSYMYNMTRGEYWPTNDTYNHYVAIDSD